MIRRSQWIVGKSYRFYALYIVYRWNYEKRGYRFNARERGRLKLIFRWNFIDLVARRSSITRYSTDGKRKMERNEGAKAISRQGVVRGRGIKVIQTTVEPLIEATKRGQLFVSVTDPSRESRVQMWIEAYAHIQVRTPRVSMHAYYIFASFD